MSDDHDCRFDELQPGDAVLISRTSATHSGPNNGCGQSVPIVDPVRTTFFECDGIDGQFTLDDPFPCPHCGRWLLAVTLPCWERRGHWEQVEQAAVVVFNWPIKYKVGR